MIAEEFVGIVGFGNKLSCNLWSILDIGSCMEIQNKIDRIK
jgi:hypothetical protein